MPSTLYTVGHSNLDADSFFAMLARHGIERLVDVRAFPGSRRHPHFAREALAAASAEHAIAYRWMPALGGRRRANKDSPHSAWEVAAFQAYADYMDTHEFAAALDELCGEARLGRTAAMCAEARWWQCHRRLISDRLVVAGWEVLHIGGASRASPHALPEFARVVDGRVIYDRGTTSRLDLGSESSRD